MHIAMVPFFERTPLFGAAIVASMWAGAQGLRSQSPLGESEDNITWRQPLCFRGRRNATQMQFGGPITHEEVDFFQSTESVVLNDGRQAQIARCPAKNIASTDKILGESAPAIWAYLESQLVGLDKALPVIVAVAEGLKSHGTGSQRMTFNFLCGMSRLGLQDRLLTLAVDSGTLEVLSSLPKAQSRGRLLHHADFKVIGERIAVAAGVWRQASKMLKMLLPLMLLQRGYEVILTDLDSYWVVDPTKYLQGLPADVAGMRGFCQAQINSGFLYYKPTQKAVQILQTALTIRKDMPPGVDQETDNDQFLFNCANAHVLSEGGAATWLLPAHAFTFGTLGFVNRYCFTPANQSFVIPYYGAANLVQPVVWHLGTGSRFGNSSAFFDTMMLEKLGFWDLHADNETCLDGSRGSLEEQRIAAQSGYDSCRTISHIGCMKC